MRGKRIMMWTLCAVLFGSFLSFVGCGKDTKTMNTEETEEVLKNFDTWCMYTEEYLKELRDTYKLEEMTKDCVTDYEKVVVITKWVSGLWKHDGGNIPEKEDPLYVLDQVVNHGKRYRCVEYGNVISGCLQALGLESRCLCMKLKEVETTVTGAGHVASEVFLNDIQKWVFIDGQWGAIPLLDDTPLNAYEFGRAIQDDDTKLKIDWINNVYDCKDKYYCNWIKPYLYYLDTTYMDKKGKQKAIMYVPEGGKEITVFQRKHTIKMNYYLKDISCFYRGQKEQVIQ